MLSNLQSPAPSPMLSKMINKFSTELLDRVLAEDRQRQEQRRQEALARIIEALEELSSRFPFDEAYIFGSLVKPYRFFEGSDMDIAFVGLADEHFFKAAAFLSQAVDLDVDVLELEGHPLKAQILKEGLRWKRES